MVALGERARSWEIRYYAGSSRDADGRLRRVRRGTHAAWLRATVAAALLHRDGDVTPRRVKVVEAPRGQRRGSRPDRLRYLVSKISKTH